VGAWDGDRMRDLLPVLGGAIAAAVTSVLAKQALEHGSTPDSLLVIRYLITGLVLAVPLVATRSFPRSRRAFGLSAAIGAGLAIGGTCEFEAIARVPVSVVIVILCSAPVWVALHTRIHRRQRIGPARRLSFVMVFTGVVLLVGPELDTYDALGLALSVAASVSWAACLILMQEASAVRGFSAPAAVASGGIVAGAATLLLNPGAIDAELIGGPHPWLALALGLTAATVFGLISLGMRAQHAFDVSVVASSEPLFVAALAAVFLGERLGAWQVAGIVVVAVGLGWLSRDEALPLAAGDAGARPVS
jgi:drug/metabolite transporter (DMT)-like permease